MAVSCCRHLVGDVYSDGLEGGKGRAEGGFDAGKFGCGLRGFIPYCYNCHCVLGQDCTLTQMLETQICKSLNFKLIVILYKLTIDEEI